MKGPIKERPIFPGKNPLKKLSDERGVSPVIAVILMVAITVVLAAVLYVMVMGIIGGGDTQPFQVSMRWQETNDEPGTYSGTILSKLGKSPNIADIDIGIISDNGVGSKKLNEIKAEGNWTVGPIVVNYYDMNNDNKLGAQDIFIISGLSPGDTVRLTREDGGEITTQTF